MGQRHEVVVDGVVKREVPSKERADEVAKEYEGTGNVVVRPAK